MQLYLIRNIYTQFSTIGDLLINHQIFCHTLEDVVRPLGAPKVFGKTAIPAGRYQVVLTMSERFKRITPQLINVPGFTGVRIHGGNKPEDTEGCLLVAKSIIAQNHIAGSMETMLTNLLSNHSENHYIEIINTFPYAGIGEQ